MDVTLVISLILFAVFFTLGILYTVKKTSSKIIDKANNLSFKFHCPQRDIENEKDRMARQVYQMRESGIRPGYALSPTLLFSKEYLISDRK